jgi:hypothetical protein
MFRLAFLVEDADGERRVDVGPSTLIAWERKTGRKVSDFSNGIGAEDMAWLVWHAEKRTGNTQLGFDKYHEQLLDLGGAPAPKVTSDEGPSDD